MGACLAITLPLEIVLGARVYRRPRRVLRVLVPVVALFVAWDALAIARGHWTFSPHYTTGWSLPFGIPVEELVFFVVIPVCALLTYEAVRRLLRGDAGDGGGQRSDDAVATGGGDG
ncbi:lycopene cyclase domain-containing protein [Thermasporomyces composti]|mgnify:CR=1 FL=1|jgi:lycopene cyclase domain-containing protein|uniref:Lycopene cyclase domain-containing protein n=2 Tax=Thermasporomyces composti TaxID=696763 RepID=A0A3D9VDJ1_THECX|nr:lycopene cyclase domain-containing protein [Thermasporomyces composti]